MSAPQFEYGGYTLDELRSLAASPQVGTMQAMPASFRALADHVGEVADLLSHAQADLPNWWKGPAADQAAATLGRAAAEAREFHGSATAAASAVSRCAQVVAEQQNQMMGVPDVPEPGVTAVVQRPATPFEALEAARQDAAYQAAHEQAVQVVNGIAAQYVETRGQLNSIDFLRGENFSVQTTYNKSTETTTTESFTNLPNTSIQRDEAAAAPPYGTATTTPFETSNYNRRIKGSFVSTRERLPYLSTVTEAPALPMNAVRTPGLRQTTVRPSEARLARDTPPLHSTHDGMPLTVPTLDEGLVKYPGPADRYKKAADTSSLDKGAAQANPNETSGSIGELEATTRSLSSSDRRLRGFDASIARQPFGDHPNNRRLASNVANDQRGPSESSASTAFRQQPSPNPLVGETSDNSDSATMVPPYGGIGSVRSERERRNPRPAYLKEQKSVWLSDTFAAPPDGVISADSLEQR